MSEFVTYDKISWHYPNEKGCQNLEEAKVYFSSIMSWLSDHGLLSKEGEEDIEIGIDSSFSLNSSMLSEKGNKLLSLSYDDWAKEVQYGQIPDMTILETAFSKLP